MDQLRKFFGSLSLAQRFSLGFVVVLAVASIVFLQRWNKDRDFKPMYSSLSPEDAGVVIAKLKESGTEYRLRESDSTILVPSQKMAELRLQMATQGIPKSGRIGYELFDKTNLGTTDFTEQVNYHRAIEGELERSLMAMSEVSQARVHITFPKDSLFTDKSQPAKASVMVALKAGATLSPGHATAISQLVSSAVDGLAPEAISVMDMRGNLLIRPKKPGDGSEPSDELLQYKTRLERETLSKLNSVLDPLIGSSKYRASVDIDCDLTSGEESEESYDPNRSVITSSQRSEEGSVAHDASGVPGTASNLPRPVTRPAGQGSGLARRTENTNYETSRVVKRLKLPQGIVRRMSVSVLVDQNLRWEVVGKGVGAHAQRVIEPPSADRMKTIQAVVAAASGINTTRGDQLTVETLPFEATLTSDPPASLLPTPPVKPGAPVPIKKQISPMILSGLAGGAIALVIAALLYIRKRKRHDKKLAEIQAQLAAATQAAELKAAEAAALQQLAEAQQSQGTDRSSASFKAPGESFILPEIMTTKSEVLTKQVAEEARKDPAALAQIVRTWLNETAKA